MFIFRVRYFILTLVLLLVEVLIAVYVHDTFIRPYAGDFLVVIFLYCLIRCFVKTSTMRAVIAVLLFSFIIETLQYFHFITLLHLQHSTLARVMLGTSFSGTDLIVYIVGAMAIIVTESLCNE
jgi:hypothetical protein